MDRLLWFATMEANVSFHQRLPLGSLLRDESSGAIYFLIKAEEVAGKLAYNFCCIFDPRQEDQSAPLTFNFLVGDEKANKFTVLNTDITTGSDGRSIHSLSLLPECEVETLYKNTDFMLRFITACKFYTRGRRHYQILGIDPGTVIVFMARKTTWVERVLTGAEYLGYNVTWLQLLDEYIPFIPEDLDEQAYMHTLAENCYFCKGTSK